MQTKKLDSQHAKFTEKQAELRQRVAYRHREFTPQTKMQQWSGKQIDGSIATIKLEEQRWMKKSAMEESTLETDSPRSRASSRSVSLPHSSLPTTVTLTVQSTLRRTAVRHRRSNVEILHRARDMWLDFPYNSSTQRHSWLSSLCRPWLPWPTRLTTLLQELELRDLFV